MAFELGAVAINKVYLGGTEINKVMLGGAEIYASGGGGGGPTYGEIVVSFGGSSGPSGNINHIYANGTKPRSRSNLVDASGTVTSVSVSYTTSNLTGSGTATKVTGSNSTASLNNTTLRGAYTYSGSGASADITVTFSGLVPGWSYTFRLVASHTGTVGTYPQSVIINGVTKTGIDVAEYPITIHEYTGIVADGAGQITLFTEETAGINYAYLSGVSVEPEEV